MCGIVGSFNNKNYTDFSFLKTMSKKLINRGPDDYGEYFDNNVGFCFRRLSIVDLSKNSNQPLTDDRYVIVFNGEIYNFRELKDQIIKSDSNIKFISHGDAEVILKAYSIWGKDCLNKLEGMFAFAIWDKFKKSLFIARDRFGEKPLFYSMSKNYGFVFASELKCFIDIPGLLEEQKIDSESLNQYLSLNYLLAEKTFLNGVINLKPGHFIYIDENSISKNKNEIKEKKFWSLSDIYNSSKNKSKSEKDVIKKFDFLLKQSLKKRSFSNVDNGIYLSGGIDSSLMTMAAKNLSTSFNFAHNLSFSQRSYDESKYAKLVSNKYDFLLKVYLIENKYELTDDFENIIESLDQPMSDTAIISNFYLSKFSSKYSKVCLSADGADELFCGYETYTADIIKKKLPNFFKKNKNYFYNSINKILPNSIDKVNFKYKFLKFFENINYEDAISHVMWRSNFSENEKKDLLKNYDENHFLNLISEVSNLDKKVQNCNFLDRYMYLDFKTWFHGDILQKIDRTSMFHSQETRLPFLDTELVNFAVTLPIHLKIKIFDKKIILKKILSKNFGKSFVNRKKSGFNFPIGYFLINNKKFKEMSFFLLNTEKMQKIFCRKFIENLWQKHQEKKIDNSYKIFNLMCFSQWIKCHNIKI